MVPTEEMKMLRAFHGDKKIKAKYVNRVKAHEKADEIVQGKYWQNGKGCAVGCTLEAGNEHYDLHKKYETELGIPEAIAHVEDVLFELMSNEDAKKFPRCFLEAIPVGADLSLVPAKLIVFILDDVLGVKEVVEDKKVTAAIKKTQILWKKTSDGKKVTSAAWSAAEIAARSAARSARSAARSCRATRRRWRR